MLSIEQETGQIFHSHLFPLPEFSGKFKFLRELNPFFRPFDYKIPIENFKNAVPVQNSRSLGKGIPAGPFPSSPF